MNKRYKGHLLLLFGLVLIFGSCSLLKKDKERPSIVFCLIDALRKDHVSCYGYERKTTPSIDLLAKKGLLFENAIAQAPWTGSSIASIFTSKYPSQIGVGVVEDSSKMKNLGQKSFAPLKNTAVTLAEVLNEADYETFGISSNAYVSDAFGMLQGFAKKTYSSNIKADEIINTSLEYIKNHMLSSPQKKPGPFFMYLHFMDLHEPNDPPPPYDKLFPTVDSAPHKEEQKRWKFGKAENLDTREFEVFKSHKIALYDGSLAFVDFQIKRLVDYLKENGLYKKTILVIASDHGEEFWDHALFEKKHHKDPRGVYGVGHGHSLFKELLNVPMIFHGRGVPRKRVEQQVRNIDLTPTVLGLAGIRGPKENMEGIDLTGKLKKNKRQNQIAFSEEIAYGYEKKSLESAIFKYIRGQEIEFLFDKTNDPDELTDISKALPKVTSQFQELMDDVLGNFKLLKKKAVFEDEKLIEQLRSLGYVK